MTRFAALATLGRFARPAALLVVWRGSGASVAEHAALLWIAIEIGARLATLGFDRGLVRVLPGASRASRHTLLVAAAAITTLVAILAGAALAAPLHASAPLLSILVAGYALANLALATPLGARNTRSRALAWGVIEPVAFALGTIAISPLAGQGLALLALAIAAVLALRGPVDGSSHVDLRAFLVTSFSLAIADAFDLVARRADQLIVVALFRAPELVATYLVTRELVAVSLGRDAIEHVLAPRLAARLRVDARHITALAILVALPLAAVELLLLPVHTPLALALTAIVILGRCADLATSAPYIALVTIAAPSLAIIASATELVVLAGSATLLTPLAIALGAALAPLARNLTARHFLES